MVSSCIRGETSWGNSPSCFISSCSSLEKHGCEDKDPSSTCRPSAWTLRTLWGKRYVYSSFITNHSRRRFNMWPVVYCSRRGPTRSPKFRVTGETTERWHEYKISLDRSDTSCDSETGLCPRDSFGRQARFWFTWMTHEPRMWTTAIQNQGKN